MKRRERLRAKRVQTIKQGLSLEKPFHDRAQFVDKEMYQTLKYFKAASLTGNNKLMLDIAWLNK